MYVRLFLLYKKKSEYIRAYISVIQFNNYICENFMCAGKLKAELFLLARY